MRQALELASEASAAGEVPVGCVIVLNGEVIGRGRNRIQEWSDPTRHAEMMAIEEATSVLGEKLLTDCTLYVTLEPCSMCAGAIVLSRIATVVFGAFDEKTGAVRSLYEVLEDKRLNHQCLVRTGILEEECSALLTSFFQKERQSSTEPESPLSNPSAEKRGTLFLVPTPIGNLNDITKRALEVLRSATVIMCEDTRSTSRLLRHYGIEGKTLVSNHDHNERGRSKEIVARVENGEDVALVSDAGMPTISDPGYRAVQACREVGLDVVALPGASAAITAAAASGLPTDRLYIAGFPPQKKGRAGFLERVLSSSATIVLYESPHRILKLCGEIADLGGADREVCVAREISKKFEEYIAGSAGDVRDEIQMRGGLKGEIVVVIGGAQEE